MTLLFVHVHTRVKLDTVAALGVSEPGAVAL